MAGTEQPHLHSAAWGAGWLLLLLLLLLLVLLLVVENKTGHSLRTRMPVSAAIYRRRY